MNRRKDNSYYSNQSMEENDHITTTHFPSSMKSKPFEADLLPAAQRSD